MFEALLHFIHYDWLSPTVNLKDNAQPLLELANKFSCTSLKLVAEEELAALGITVDNPAEVALMADGMSCGLLYASDIEFIVGNRDGIIQSSGYTKLQESTKVMSNLLGALSKQRNNEKDGKQVNVATLRRKLEKKGS